MEVEQKSGLEWVDVLLCGENFMFFKRIIL